MLDHERTFRPTSADQDWKAWPGDIRQRASVVIAITRYAWTSRGSATPSANAADLECSGFEHPLFRRALEAIGRKAGRARSIRARNMRRASGGFAT
jgi:hypothetical protein